MHLFKKYYVQAQRFDQYSSKEYYTLLWKTGCQLCLPSALFSQPQVESVCFRQLRRKAGGGYRQVGPSKPPLLDIVISCSESKEVEACNISWAADAQRSLTGVTL